ncbi:hypothetical protein BGW38_004790, partial [Lunasporangiospora selenospora]
SESCGSPSEFESLSHFAYPSPQLDFSFLASHEALKDHNVPSLLSVPSIPDGLPTLGLTADTDMDAHHPNATDSGLIEASSSTAVQPRKRDRGERIVWTPEEDAFLIAAVQKYGDKTEKWAKIAACVPGRTNKNCRKRWFHSLDPSLKKGAWTEEEDHLLRTGVEKFKGQWSKIAERIQGRTDDQCAKRWRESLDPEIDRAAWTPEDDALLLQKFEEYGSQWQKIALSFPGRPGLHCRNRWRKLQRSLNHLQRGSKRRRNLMDERSSGPGSQDQTDGLLDSRSTLLSFSGRDKLTSADDALFLSENFLDDEFSGIEDGDDMTKDKDDRDGGFGHCVEEEKPYGCAVPECSFVSSSPSLLFYHFKASHPGATIEKPFKCTMPGCQDRKRYKNINGLQYHVTHAKNTPGHSGHGGGLLPENSPDIVPRQAPRTTKSPAMTALSGTQPSPTPPPLSTSASPPHSMSGPFVDLNSHTFSGPSIPTEIHSQLHSTISQSLISRPAFNIPHTPDTIDTTSIVSPMPLDLPLQPHQLPPFICPELGCGQIFHLISSLNAHMANNHGHKSMTMKSTDIDTLVPDLPDSIAIPEHDFDDMDMDLDMDMAYLASESASPMEHANILLMEDPELQTQLDLLANEHAALSLDSHPIGMGGHGGDHGLGGSSSNSFEMRRLGISKTYGMLSMNDLLLANAFANSMSNRIHFGTHINVRADEPNATLPVTPVASANVSPKLQAIHIPSAPVSAAAGVMPTLAPVPAPLGLVPEPSTTPPVVPVAPTPGKLVPAKKFPCAVQTCSRSYASNATMRAHLRHDHPDFLTTAARPSSTSPSIGGTITNVNTAVHLLPSRTGPNLMNQVLFNDTPTTTGGSNVLLPTPLTIQPRPLLAGPVTMGLSLTMPPTLLPATIAPAGLSAMAALSAPA